jgi:hypothetical protein
MRARAATAGRVCTSERSVGLLTLVHEFAREGLAIDGIRPGRVMEVLAQRGRGLARSAKCARAMAILEAGATPCAGETIPSFRRIDAACDRLDEGQRPIARLAEERRRWNVGRVRHERGGPPFEEVSEP